MNSPKQHIPISQIDPGNNVGDGEGSVQVHLEEDLMQTTAKVFAIYGKEGSVKVRRLLISQWRFLSWANGSSKSAATPSMTRPLH